MYIMFNHRQGHTQDSSGGGSRGLALQHFLENTLKTLANAENCFP